MDEGSYYGGYTEGAEDNRKKVLYTIGIVLLCVISITVIWVCIMITCSIPKYFKRTMDTWMDSSSLMKRKLASRMTGTPFEETGPERERRWHSRQPPPDNSNAELGRPASTFS
nr:movement protein [Sophora yellow stunt virus]